MTDPTPATLLADAHAAGADFDAEFFFDPVCPWAWLTSRWVTEVVNEKGLNIHWNFICLKFLNEGKTLDPAYAERAAASHGRGLRLLRVCAAVREAHGASSVWAIYTEFGKILHVESDAERLDSNASIELILKDLGHDPALASAADNDQFDAQIRASTELALSRTGRDVGTPIITYGTPDGPSLFGPVISVAPKGAAAVEMWDHVEFLAKNPDFAELKRQIRVKPRFD
jgi:2-hydroxychromene-2-carboxylate isomerase